MDNDVGISILQSNNMQVIPHSDLKEVQEKGINGIPNKEQHRYGGMHASSQLILKPSVNRGVFRCPACNEVFTCIKDMRDHSVFCKSWQKTNRLHSCIHCKKTFKRFYNLTLHLKVCGKRRVKKFTHLSGQIPALIKCAFCPASYISEDAFLDHMASYHGTDERITPTNYSAPHIECAYPKCEFKASSDVILQAHVVAYHMKKQISIKHRGVKPLLPYKCQYCDASFADESVIMDHIKNHGEMSLKVCGKRRVKKFTHLSGQIPAQIKCAFCPASYISEDAFLDHMASYHGTDERITPTNYSAPHIECAYPKCEFKASSDAILQAHVVAYHMKKQISIKHRGVKPLLPYKCQYCDASFADESVIMDHIKNHGEMSLKEIGVELCERIIAKPVLSYKCQFCDASFCVESSLKKHIKDHGKRSKKEMVIESCKRITVSWDEVTQKNTSVRCIPEDANILNEVQIGFHGEYCGKTFSGANEQANHLKKHSEKNIKYKVQKEQCTSIHDNVLKHTEMKIAKCTYGVDSVNIAGDVDGEESSSREVEKITSPKNNPKIYRNMLTPKHNQEQIRPEKVSKEYIDPSHMILNDDECDDVNIVEGKGNTVKSLALMKCDFCSAAFVCENVLKDHLQKHKVKKNKVKKFGWFGWELHPGTDTSPGHGMSNSQVEVQNHCCSQKADNEMITSEEHKPSKVLEIRDERVNESSVFENFYVSKNYIDTSGKDLYPPEVKEENCSGSDFCMMDSKEMIKIDIKKELEEENQDSFKEELE